jgi:hypothetical protein
LRPRKQRWLTGARYSAASPSQFNVGDLVEAQFVSALVPVERGKRQLQLVLQAVTLLNNSYTQVSSRSTGTIEDVKIDHTRPLLQHT